MTKLGLKFNVSEGKTEAMMLLHPDHARRYEAHLKAYERDDSLGFFANNAASTTADTEDCVRFQVMSTSATHLWCPVCKYCQVGHSSPSHAFGLLKDHWKAHPELRLEKTPPVANTRLTFAPPPAPRERAPIAPTPAFNFVLTAGTHPVTIKWTLQYKYLGHILDHAGNTSAAVHTRRLKANGAFMALSRIWDSNVIETRIKVFIFEACIRSTLLSGLESIVPSDKDIKELQSFYEMALRRITGFRSVIDPWDNEVLFSYEMLLTMADTVDVTEILRDKRLTLAGRIARCNRGHPMEDLYRRTDGTSSSALTGRPET